MDYHPHFTEEEDETQGTKMTLSKVIQLSARAGNQNQDPCDSWSNTLFCYTKQPFQMPLDEKVKLTYNTVFKNIYLCLREKNELCWFIQQTRRIYYLHGILCTRHREHCLSLFKPLVHPSLECDVVIWALEWNNDSSIGPSVPIW